MTDSVEKKDNATMYSIPSFDGNNPPPLPEIRRKIVNTVTRDKFGKNCRGKIVLDFSETIDVKPSKYSPYYLVVGYGSDVKRTPCGSMVARYSTDNSPCGYSVMWNNTTIEMNFSVIPEGVLSISMFKKVRFFKDEYIGSGSLNHEF